MENEKINNQVEQEKSNYEKLFEGYDLNKSQTKFEWDEPTGKEII